MYIIQENVDSNYWTDLYKSSDYAFICEMLSNFREKHTNIKYRIIEVFIYV